MPSRSSSSLPRPSAIIPNETPHSNLTPPPPTPSPRRRHTLIPPHWPPNRSTHLASLTEREPDPHRRTHKPKTGADERKRLGRAPLVAEAAVGNAAPVESRALAAGAVEDIDEEAEGGEPGKGEEDVEGPVEDAAREWEEPVGEGGLLFGVGRKGEGEVGLPEDACEDRDAGDDFGVDEAFLGPGGGAGVVEIGADYACDYLEGDQYEQIIVCIRPGDPGGCLTHWSCRALLQGGKLELTANEKDMVSSANSLLHR